jgi:outer membrane biosynthesis protein TonB
VGEVLIGVDGKVRGVWPVKEVEFSPPWPEFNEAIEAAVRQWVFEPTKADGRPVPVCMAVSVGASPR